MLMVFYCPHLVHLGIEVLCSSGVVKSALLRQAVFGWLMAAPELPWTADRWELQKVNAGASKGSSPVSGSSWMPEICKQWI